MPPVYWINLDVSHKRRHRLVIELERSNITSHYRVPAVCPAELSLYDIKECSEAGPIVPTEWCCTISHLKAIWTAWHDGHEVALILEDDVCVVRSPVQPEVWRCIEASVPDENWQILQLLSFGDKAVALMMDNEGPLWVPWSSGMWSTGAYIINRTGMVNMLQTYAPGTLDMISWTNVRLDFSQMQLRDTSMPQDAKDQRARCVADWAIYVAVNTWTCSDVFMSETAEDSTIKPVELPLHAKSVQTIAEIAKGNRYKLKLPL
ncbi:hypothetical protein ABBQ32_008704 [Trebouxia sp. C0010 RCD-2024]